MDNKNKNNYKKLAKNSVFFFISSFGSKLLVFFLLPLYTTYLSTAEYGIADLINTAVSLLFFIFTLDIGAAILRFVMQRKNTGTSVLRYGFFILLIGFSLLSLITILFCVLKVFNWPVYCYIFFAIIFLLHGTNDLLTNYLKGTDRVLHATVASLLLSIVTLVSSILLIIVFKMQLFGYLLTTVLGFVAAIIYMGIIALLNKNQFNSEKISKETKLSMLSYCIPLAISGFGWWLNLSLGKFIVAFVCGDEQAGIYAAATKIPALITVCFTIFVQAWVISAIEEYGENDNDASFFNNVYNAINAFTIVFASILIVFNKQVVSFILRGDFFEAAKYTPFLLVSSLFSGFAGILEGIFAAKKKNRVVGLSTLCASVVNLVATYFLVSSIGLIGAAISAAISFAIIWAIRLIFAGKIIPIKKANLLIHLLSYVLICLQAFLSYIGFNQIWIQGLILIALIGLNVKNIILFFSRFKTVLKKN